MNFMKHVMCKNAQFWKYTKLGYIINCEWYMCDSGPYEYIYIYIYKTHYISKIIIHYMTNYGIKLYIFLCSKH